MLLLPHQDDCSGSQTPRLEAGGYGSVGMGTAIPQHSVLSGSYGTPLETG